MLKPNFTRVGLAPKGVAEPQVEAHCKHCIAFLEHTFMTVPIAGPPGLQRSFFFLPPF